MLCFDKVSVSLCVALIVVETKLTGQLRSLACSSCHKIQKNGGVSTVRGHEWQVAFVAAVIEEILPQLWYSLSTKFRNLKYCSNSTIRILEVTILNDFYSSIKYISPGSIHIQSNWCILLQATSRMSLYYKLSITWHWFGKEHFLFFFPPFVIYNRLLTKFRRCTFQRILDLYLYILRLYLSADIKNCLVIVEYFRIELWLSRVNLFLTFVAVQLILLIFSC